VRIGILTLRGHAAQAVQSLDWLAIASSRLTDLERIIQFQTTAAAARAALGQHAAAAALLSEIDTTPDSRESPYYAACLPTMVRHRPDHRQPATRPPARHRPATAPPDRRARTGHRPREPRRGTRRARHRRRRLWRRLPALAAVDTTPEHAHALLGHGRCLTALGHPTQATQALQHARAIYQTLNAAPALTETDTLLQQGDALTA
jgi:hypothetical protein